MSDRSPQRIRDWRSKRVLVTGAASGIGAALAADASARGAVVIAVDRAWPEETAVASDDPTATAAPPAPGTVFRFARDVRDADGWTSLAEAVLERWGAPDVLIHNAGIGVAGEFDATPIGDWDRLFDIHVRGVVLGLQAFYPAMQARGTGQIVLLASGAGLCPRPGMVAYAASKHAVIGLATSLRAEAHAHGIGVTAICPGYIATAIMTGTTWRGIDGAGLQSAIPIRPTTAASCADQILRAAARDRAIVPIGAEVHAEWWLWRLWPGLVMRIARWRAAKFRAFRLP